MNFGRFKRLLQNKGRQDRRKALGHHRLTRSRRTYQKHIMPSRCCYLQCPFDVLLPPYICKIQSRTTVATLELGLYINLCACQQTIPVKKINNLLYIPGSKYFNIVHNRGFPRVACRQYKPLKTLIPRFQRDRQSALHRQQAAIK